MKRGQLPALLYYVIISLVVMAAFVSPINAAVGSFYPQADNLTKLLIGGFVAFVLMMILFVIALSLRKNQFVQGRFE